MGETLESLFPDRLEENASLLAYHFDEANEHKRALHYYRMAGDAAYRLFAVREASDHYGRALSLVKQSLADGEAKGKGNAEQDERYDQLQYLSTQLGRGLELDGRFDQAMTVYEETESMGREHNEPALQLAALMAQATLYAIPNPEQSYELGETISDRALDLARELGDRGGRSQDPVDIDVDLWGDTS